MDLPTTIASQIPSRGGISPAASMLATLNPQLFTLMPQNLLTAPAVMPWTAPLPALLNAVPSVGSPSGAARTVASASSATPAPATPTGSSNTALIAGGVVVTGAIIGAVYYASKKSRRRGRR